MKRLMLDHAFHFVEHVVLLVGPNNVRSQRAVEKIGGVRAGMRLDPKTGRDNVLFVLARPSVRSTVLWRRIDMPGHEVSALTELPNGWRLSGVAVLAHEKRPCRMEYDIECDAAWRTRRVRIRGHVASTPVALDLTRDDASAWSADGALVSSLQGCLDVDLGFSPSTNLLPVRRLGLAVGAHAAVRAVWVRFPELTLEVLEQTYTRTGAATYRYESAGGAFQRELSVNADGFVLEYPDFWRAEAERVR